MHGAARGFAPACMSEPYVIQAAVNLARLTQCLMPSARWTVVATC